MSSLKGKKLLILAASCHEVDLVMRAKKLGVYTIVTDYYNPEISPAKKVADEYWNISWSDIDALEKKCKEEKVDGITAGYSEFTVENLIRLCEKLDLPCYCTKEQLEITRDKVLFKEECRKNGVPVVNEYNSIDSVKSFPVIVKPVDRGGSIGISVANNMDELTHAYKYAMDMSICKKVIIEDFIYAGTKFDVYYAVINGNITYLSSSDTINAKENGFAKVVQSGWTLPSKYNDKYLESVDKNIRNMISGMKVKFGFFFFSGFADENGFVFFETGFRLSGGHLYKYFEAAGYPNIQDIFIYHALTGNVDFANDSTRIDKSVKCAVVNYYAKAGVLSKISGIKEIEKMDTCGFALPMCHIGTKCDDNQAILTKIAMFHFYSNDFNKIKASIDKANELFVAEDEFGNDIVYDRMDFIV